MKVLVYGSLNIDLIFSVDHIVRPGETISSSALEKGAGGKGANQAAALAKAGMTVYMAGKIGSDGEFLLDLLQSYGVNTDHVARYEGATGQALIQLDKDHQNSIVLFAGGNGVIQPEEIDSVLGCFGEGDIIVLQNEITQISEIMKQAKKRGLKICLNPSPFDEKIEARPLDLVDIFFVNEIEGAALAALEVPSVPLAPFALSLYLSEIFDRLIDRFPNAEIILTKGKDGAFYAGGKKRARGEIIDTPVVDTTGAGDTFTGYFIAARSKDFSIEESLDIACKAASIAVSRKGAMQSIPFKEEVF
ncbi:MAG: ribokinase [Treponema sp.]|jgi:ribokinase|nr:ribokinase [Treponema sp.]